jgi:hypothetical protein
MTRTRFAPVFLLTVVGVVCAVRAQPTSQWTLWGFSDRKTGDEELFYLNSDIRRLSEGHLQVWTKALPEKKMSRARTDQGLIQRAVEKLTHDRYVLPYGKTHSLTDAQRLLFVLSELVADANAVDTDSKVLYEVDCVDRMTRPLSVIFLKEGSLQSSDTPGEWGHIAPESNGATLATLLCTSV